MKKAEHIAAYFEPAGAGSRCSPASARPTCTTATRASLPLVAGGADVRRRRRSGQGARTRTSSSASSLPYTVTRAKGAVPSFVVNAEDAVDGKQSALVTLGTSTEVGINSASRSAGRSRQDLYVRRLRQAAGNARSRPPGDRAAGEPLDRAVRARESSSPRTNGPKCMSRSRSRSPSRKAGLPIWPAGKMGPASGRTVPDHEGITFLGRTGSRQTRPPPRSPSRMPASKQAKRRWTFTCDEQYNLRRTYRRGIVHLARLLGNMGVAAPTPLLARFTSPVTDVKPKSDGWLDSISDQPEEWDDPYRFFNW